jgi:SAM-dependent methyltransferase
VDAVERSHAFATRLAALCRRDRLGPGEIWQTDLLEAPLPEGHYDLVFARWVFLFLPDPEAHLEKLHRAVKPGGLVALEDYHRETFALIPRPPEWGDFLAADRAFFASQGGDVSIGGRLPELYRRVGFVVREILPTVKIARPGSPAWKWISDYFLGVMDRYAEHRPFTPSQAESLRRGWLKASTDPTSVMIAPAVLDVVGHRPDRRPLRPRRSPK